MSSIFRYQPFVAVSGNLGGKVSGLTISCRPMNKKSILQTHSMKTAQSLNFKRIGTITLIWDRCTWLWNWNLSGVVVTKPQYQRSKKGTQRRGKSRRGRDGGRGGSSSSRYSCKQHLALNFFQCWSVHQQSTNFQHYWIVCAKIVYFQHLQGSHLWIQGSFALRGVRLSRSSWRNYGSSFV